MEKPDLHPEPEPLEFYTVSQVAKLLQLTEMTVYRMIARKELPCYMIGRVKRFRHNDIEEYLQQCRVPSAREEGRNKPVARKRVSRH